MNEDANKEYYTPKELGEILSLGRNKVYRLCSIKGFPAIKFGSTYRINCIKFHKWLEVHEGMDIYLG